MVNLNKLNITNISHSDRGTPGLTLLYADRKKDIQIRDMWSTNYYTNAKSSTLSTLLTVH